MLAILVEELTARGVAARTMAPPDDVDEGELFS